MNLKSLLLSFANDSSHKIFIFLFTNLKQCNMLFNKPDKDELPLEQTI